MTTTQPALRPTAEQQAIIDACRDGHDLVIEAGAGTGKTSTLKMASRSMRGAGLYLAYNKVTAVEAKAAFPDTVDCRTAHSLAFHAVGRRYTGRMDTARQTGRDLADILGVHRGVTLDTAGLVKLGRGQLARLGVATVSQFCMSARREITVADVPAVNGVEGDAREVLQRLVLPIARTAWEDLQHDDRSGRGRLRFLHDHYLKLWQLTGPRLPVDYLLFDEAQDANPVIEAVVRAQGHLQTVAVGDSCQQLYAWRGAVDALSRFDADLRLYLSQSWRFGTEIADEANKWLTVAGATMRLVGAPGQRGRIGEISGWPAAILCRSNAETVRQALAGLAAGLRVAIAGGGTSIRGLAVACLELKDGRGTSHPELFAFNTWGEVQDYVEEADDAGELRTFVTLIDEHGAEEVIAAMDQLVDEEPARRGRGYSGRPWSAPDVVVSTGHKAKGREWQSVRIGDDFQEPVEADGRPAPISRADANLAYVAVTRARRELDRGPLAYIDGRVGA